jgi:uncharacterized protein (TIGR01244 family)
MTMPGHVASLGRNQMSTLARLSAIALLSVLPGLVPAGESPLASLPRHVALDAHRHASGQPTAEALAQLPGAGITTVIDLRPDQETPELDEKSVAEKAGLKYRALPISGAADLTRENVTRFDQLLKATANENVLIHCASGNRVGAMLALQARWVQGKSAEEALAIGKAAGMTGLATDVQKLLDAPAAAPQSSPVR